MYILMMHFVLISDEACTSNDLDGGPDHVDNCTPSKSPTKVRLRKQIAMHRRREARLRNKLKHANMLNAHLRKRTDLQIAKDVISTYLSGTAYELVMAQLVGSITKRRKRWSKNMKLYCLSLYYKSPSAYRFLRNTFSIPSVRTYF